MTDELSLKLVAQVQHVPFVLAFLVAGFIAMRRYRTSPKPMGLLLAGLGILTFERVLVIWLYFFDTTSATGEDVAAVAGQLKALIYLDWALAVVGLVLVIGAALLQAGPNLRGEMPNKSLERTREG